MDISREAATTKGPAETFTGEVWVDPITRGLPPSRLNVAAEGPPHWGPHVTDAEYQGQKRPKPVRAST